MVVMRLAHHQYRVRDDHDVDTFIYIPPSIQPTHTYTFNMILIIARSVWS